MSAGREGRIRLFVALVLLAMALGVGISANSALAGVPVSNTGVGNSNAAQSGGSGQSVKPTTPFDCSQIAALGIDKQMNMRAAELLASCGKGSRPVGAPGKAGGNQTAGAGKYFRPLAYGGTDKNVILPDSAYPKVTQSETFVWGHGNTVVANYNDSRTSSACYSGLSYSLDGGTTWVAGQPLCTGHGTNYGDPTVVWDNAHSVWVATDLATGCGGQGIGAWTSTNGVTWTTGACAHNGSQDDRQSSWVDNTPSSPFYGRIYVSFANYALSGPPISVTYSTDGGVTWTVPTNLALPAGLTFVRNVQDTGGPDGSFFIAAMDEGGGGLANRRNFIYRSTNGGVSFDPPILVTNSFPAPGVATSGYFALMFPTIWRHMGWGQPAVGPGGVVHYVWAQHGAGADAGDVYYSRSTDNGSTWSAPLKMNTDSTTQPQWQPNMAVNATGAVLVGWYDGRNGTGCTPGSGTPCYERWGRASLDNGLTWQADDVISDAPSGLPAQPDSAVQTTYEGDYDYSSADGTNFYQTWVDGRVLISGNAQQDVFFDKIPVIQGTPTPTATPCSPVPCTSTPTRTPTFTFTPTATPCGVNGNYNYTQSTGTIDPGITDVGNHCDDCVTAITLPFPYSLYGQSYTTASVSSNGQLDFGTADSAFSNTCLPDTAAGFAIFPFWDDQLTNGAGGGIFTSTSGAAPNRIFNIEWRSCIYNAGSCGASINYEIRLYEGQNRFDVVYGTMNDTGTGATVGVQRDTGSLFTQFECNTGGLTSGLLLIFTQPSCGTNTPTATGTLPTQTFTNTPTRTFTPTTTLSPTLTPTITLTPTPQCGGYTTTTTTGTIVPGTTDVGNHIDDGTTAITFPFPVTFYGVPYTSGFVSSNGNLQLTGNSTYLGVSCPLPNVNLGASIMPYQDDLRTDGVGDGIFTAVLGTAPNRQFVIEWRTTYFGRTGNSNEELIFYENSPVITMIYGANADNGASEESGVQSSGVAGSPATQYSCLTATLTNGLRVDYTPFTNCSPTATFTRTSTPTITLTPTITRTPTITSTPSATRTPAACGLRILLVSADCGTAPATLQNNLLALPGVQTVDIFDALNGTPTLAQLLGYDVVVPFSNCGYSDQTTLGNNLADYEDANGVVVAFNFDWYGSTQSIGGRWSTGGYSPFLNNAAVNFSTSSLATCTFAPLCNGIVTAPTTFYRETVTLAAGATAAGTWADSTLALAYLGRAVAMSGYVGDGAGNWSGDFARIIVNAGTWLRGNPCATSTPTATGTPPTATRTFTPTRTFTVTNTPTITSTPTSSSTPTITPTVAPCGPFSNYVYATGTATMIPGVTDTGNHCDDCLSTVTLPFTYNLYGQAFTTVSVSSNGQMDFQTGDNAWTNTCLPDISASYAIFPHWDDQMTDIETNCAGYPGGNCGIFTDVQGSAPNRKFIIEWRAVYYPNAAAVNYEVILYENQSRFDIVYGSVPNTGTSATVGVQKDTGSQLTQFECSTGGLTNGLLLTFTQPSCATSTPAATNTPTATNTPVGLINGHLTWQSVAQPTPGNVQTATLTLCYLGAPVNYTINTDTSGNFTLNSNLPDGTYNWRIKHSNHLASVGSFTLTGGAGPLEAGTIRGGDSIEDNLDNSQDFNNLKVNFGVTTSDLRSDFDFNALVNASDFNILKSNFGSSGANANCP